VTSRNTAVAVAATLSITAATSSTLAMTTGACFDAEFLFVLDGAAFNAFHTQPSVELPACRVGVWPDIPDQVEPDFTLDTGKLLLYPKEV
jgi:hypothetical protein